MKKQILLFTLLVGLMFNTKVYAQEEPSSTRFQRALKMSYVGNFNSSKFEYEGNSFYRRYDELGHFTLPLRNLSLALQFTNSKGNFHEFEISHLIHGTASTSPLWLSPRSTGLKYRQLSWRYERAFCLLNISRLKFYAGYGLMETIRYRADGFDGLRTPYMTELRVFFTRAYVVPRIAFQISRRLGIDVNMPIELHEHRLAYYQVRQFGSVWPSPGSFSTNRENTIGYFQFRFGLQYAL